MNKTVEAHSGVFKIKNLKDLNAMMLPTKEAVIKARDMGFTDTEIARMINEGSVLQVQSIQVRNWRTGRHLMSEKVAVEFEKAFGITIADSHRAKGRPRVW
ncbi:MAG: hypothetical protein K0U41_09105 [Gammaproteobacteria bacterium]|nr:hypothetical protein [Gammaproteobacteria bacterium]